MKEELLQFIWQYQKFSSAHLSTTEGEPLTILRPGTKNDLAGPDFNDARIKIGDTVWVGHVELHTESKLWFSHQHHLDPKYQSVILHVVLKENGAKLNIPTLELNHRIPSMLLEHYTQLMNSKQAISCAPSIDQVDGLTWLQCKDRRLIERLEYKTNQIEEGLFKTADHWQQVFYEQLAYNFGLVTNGAVFQKLAQLLPLKILAKHRQSRFQIEALLFGVSGLLEKYQSDQYAEQLSKEFDFLKSKYDLNQINQVEWNFGRIRPPSLPTIRIAQFAGLIVESQNLFSQLMDTLDLKLLREFFECSPSEYWKNHYVFGKTSQPKQKKLGRSFVDNLLINTVLPVQFIYAKRKNKEQLLDSVIANFKLIKSEQNRIIRAWKKLGVESENAFDSQALIHQYKEYCQKKRCLECVIGEKILSK